MDQNDVVSRSRSSKLAYDGEGNVVVTILSLCLV
jgi:hypothetical protein